MEGMSMQVQQIWSVLQRVGRIVEVIQSQAFQSGVDDVIDSGLETVIATAKLVQQLLDVFKISPAEFQATLEAQRAILTPFEQEVFAWIAKGE
jgi:hypothetical protein